MGASAPDYSKGAEAPSTNRSVSIREPVRQSRLAQIGRFLGVEESTDRAIDAVIRLRKGVGLPTCLSDVGAVEGDLPATASTAHSFKRLMDLSPIKPSESELLAILEASF